jgi:hypothetical protein
VTVLSNFREYTRDTEQLVICDDLFAALDDGLDASSLSDADCRLLADYTLPMIAAMALEGRA